MISEDAAVAIARSFADAKEQPAWRGGSVKTRRVVVQGHDCWRVTADDVPPPGEPDWWFEYDGGQSYLVEVATGRCIGIGLINGYTLFEGGSNEAVRMPAVIGAPMDRQRLYGAVVMAVFALVALYELQSGVTGLANLAGAITRRAPVVVVTIGDVLAVPAAMVVLVFAFLEIVRPAERWRRRLGALALGFFALTLLSPVAFRMASGPWLTERGYVRCPGRAIGYTMPATRYARAGRYCQSGTTDRSLVTS